MSLKSRQKTDAESADDAAIRLLARREHSRGELRSKLTERGLEQAAVEVALDRLESRGLLSDARFTESFVRHRVGQGHGPTRIRADLRQRGVADSLVQAVLDEAEADWEALARDVRIRRFGPALPVDYRERSKQMRFLQYRGFPTDIIRRVMTDEDKT
ncbi:regulatory protein RecX [Ectothiorhodospira shaposhnikovii]|uniref:regulatory protein RecX n=1 Tax=Ectothiorhodospira shaposhnikovii TaxID=1054 RepID=UPI001EE926CD|nr:recombination regulator RecX [Ectothiorhodospira shaposhnikovii]